MKKGIFISLLLAVVLLSACVKDTSDKLYNELVAGLKKDGLAVEEEKVESGDSILTGEEKRLKISDDNFIYVYLYKDNEEMEKDISYLSPDGFGYDNGKKRIVIDWVYQPYFYKKENMIVLYIGRDQKILGSLVKNLGEPFIGDME